VIPKTTFIDIEVGKSVSMKMRIWELRNIIKETLAETLTVEPVTDDEFIEIILSELREKIQENSFVEMFEVTVAAFIGLAGVGITIGKAASIAKQLYDSIDEFRKDEVEAAAAAVPEEVIEKVNEISDDQKLAEMYNQLNMMKGTASAEEVRSKSRQIKTYMKLKLSSRKHSYAEEVRSSQHKRHH